MAQRQFHQGASFHERNKYGGGRAQLHPKESGYLQIFKLKIYSSVHVTFRVKIEKVGNLSCELSYISINLDISKVR